MRLYKNARQSHKAPNNPYELLRKFCFNYKITSSGLTSTTFPLRQITSVE